VTHSPLTPRGHSSWWRACGSPFAGGADRAFVWERPGINRNVAGSFTGSSSVPAAERTIILEIRLPRLLLAIIVGSGLSVAGLVFQALLRNPLLNPTYLEISSGGTAGAILAMTLTAGPGIFIVPLLHSRAPQPS